MTDFIARWHDEHSEFTRLLDLLERQLELFHRAGRPNYRLMLDIMYYMTRYGDGFHHPREELAFAKAAWRDPAIAPVVDALAREHVELREMGEALVERLEAVLNEAILPRLEVERRGREYIEALRGHIRREEETIFPVVARTLRPENWDEIDRTLRERAEPDSSPAAESRLRAVCGQIAAEVRPIA